MSAHNKFLFARIHSLAGLIPLGLFLMEHMFTNSTAMLGKDVFNRQVEWLHRLPFVLYVEIFFIALPMVFHAVYGIYLSLVSRNNIQSYSYRRNWLFLFQRLTGIVTLIFVIYHVWVLRISTALTHTEVNFDLVSGHLQNPWIFAFYVLGVISTTYHFFNGVSTGLITWGITISRKSQAFSTRFCLGFFVLMSLMGILTLISYV